VNLVICSVGYCCYFVRKQAEFQAALSALEHAPAAHSLTLQSFLILPMQHVTRLPLLVDAVLHHLDDETSNRSSQDSTTISQCLESLHWVCHSLPLLQTRRLWVNLQLYATPLTAFTHFNQYLYTARI